MLLPLVFQRHFMIQASSLHMFTRLLDEGLNRSKLKHTRNYMAHKAENNFQHCSAPDIWRLQYPNTTEQKPSFTVH